MPILVKSWIALMGPFYIDKLVLVQCLSVTYIHITRRIFQAYKGPISDHYWGLCKEDFSDLQRPFITGESHGENSALSLLFDSFLYSLRYRGLFLRHNLLVALSRRATLLVSAFRAIHSVLIGFIGVLEGLGSSGRLVGIISIYAGTSPTP